MSNLKLRLAKLEARRAVGDTRLTFLWTNEPEILAIARWEYANGKPVPKICVFISWQI